MFTVKLIQGNKPNNTTTQVFSCNHYAIWEGDEWSEVILYKDYNTQDGVGYKIASSDIGVPHFDKCYIENINGKTINTVVHFNKVEDTSEIDYTDKVVFPLKEELYFTEAIKEVKEINKALKGEE